MSSTSIQLKAKDNPDHSCLLVMLGPQVTLASGLCWPLKGFRIHEKEYMETDLGGVFYDWLRDKDNRVLGIRYDIDSVLRETLRERNYVYVEPCGIVQIYFSTSKNYEPELSCDQAFLYSAVFQSADKNTVMGFEMSELNDLNLRSLQETNVEWATAQAVD